jgi:hypothetical protein
MGTDTGGNFNINEYGATDYYNLTFSDVDDASVDTFAATANVDVANAFTISGGTIDLATNTLTTNNTTNFTGGTINNGTVTVSAPSNRTATFSGTTFGANVDCTSGSILLNGSTFNGTADFTKTGTSQDLGDGGNTFNSTTTYNYTADGGAWYTAEVNPDIYNADVTFNKSNLTGSYYINHIAAGNEFNGNVVLNSTSLVGALYLSTDAAAATTLAAGNTISIGGSGFTGSVLYIRNFTQNGATAQNLAPSVSAAVLHDTSFDGDLSLTVSGLTLAGNTFNGTVNIEATSGNSGFSGNTFNSTANIEYSGNNALQLGLTSADTYNGAATFTNSGTGTLTIADGAFNNVFQGDVICVESAGTLQFGSGTLTFQGGNNQNVNLLDKATGDIVVNKSGNTLTFTDGWIANSFNGQGGTVDFNGQTVETTNNFTIGANGQVNGVGLNNSAITVGGNLNLTGQTGDLLDLEATAEWTLDVTGTAQASYVNVAFSNANGGTEIDATTGCQDSGSNQNWNLPSGGDQTGGNASQGEVEKATNDDNDDIIEELVEEIVEDMKEKPDDDIIDLRSRYGFDWGIIYEEGKKKYRKRFRKGRYHTVVVVYDGKVVAAPYNDKGPRYDLGDTLGAGDKILHEDIL